MNRAESRIKTRKKGDLNRTSHHKMQSNDGRKVNKLQGKPLDLPSSGVKLVTRKQRLSTSQRVECTQAERVKRFKKREAKREAKIKNGQNNG